MIVLVGLIGTLTYDDWHRFPFVSDSCSETKASISGWLTVDGDLAVEYDAPQFRRLCL